MSKDLTAEYNKERLAIIEQYGKPVNTPEPNESAKLLAQLKGRYYYQKRKRNQNQDRDNRIKSIEAKINRPLEMPAIPVSETDLAPFDPTEQRIIKAHFENTLLSPGEIAEKLGEGLSSQLVTSVLNSTAVKELEHKLMVQDLSVGVWEALKRGVARNDAKFIQIALDMGIGKERFEDTSKRPEIELPPRQAEALRIFGNWLVSLDGDLLGKYHLTLKNAALNGKAETIEVAI